ncbi:MAG: isoprenylcysteine carboxylmethyltransferase family protein [Candidatus Acidiferrum sp.]
MTLRSRVFLRFAVGVCFAALLFLTAGTWKFWQAWMVLGTLFLPALGIFLYFAKHNPQLLQRRLQSKEKTSQQRWTVCGLKFVALSAFLLPGLDHRFAWTRNAFGPVPLWLDLVAEVVLVMAFWINVWVMTVNPFASRTIQVEPGQPVISTGPYHFVRHPMYAASLLMYLALPIALGSYVAWPTFVLLIPFIVVRLLNEEKVLSRDLPGYSEYCLQTRSRLFPHIW